jgi:hypothetical protein
MMVTSSLREREVVRNAGWRREVKKDEVLDVQDCVCS